jgi:hypothetical protein
MYPFDEEGMYPFDEEEGHSGHPTPRNTALTNGPVDGTAIMSRGLPHRFDGV